jgi:hypothetical protein
MADSSAMTLIETKTLGTAAASIEFTSIPQTFTDLVVLVSGRSTRSDVRDEIQTQFNGDTASNYTLRTLRGSGSAVISQSVSFTALVRADMPAATSTANTFSNISYYIPNYTSAVAKSLSIESVMENNATESFLYLVAGLWNNTAAITSIFMKPEVANFAIGSVFSLYGITKGTDGTTVVS